MKMSIPAIFLGILTLTFELIVAPIFYLSLIQYRTDMNIIMAAERNFVDRTIDSADPISALQDLDMDLGQASMAVAYEVVLYRETYVKDATGKVTTAYEPILVDPNTPVDAYQGDIIRVKVEPKNLSIWQVISSVLFNASGQKQILVLSGRIR